MGRIDIAHQQIPKHVQECQFLTALLIDLKLQLAGIKPGAPITAERLHLASEAVMKINACEESRRIMWE